MKKITFLLLVLQISLNLSAIGASSRINLRAPNGTVVSDENRNEVLLVAEDYLVQRDSDFVATLDTINNPYLYEQPKEEAAQSPSAPRQQTSGATNVVYNDASVVQAVSRSFSKQVRGTLARGSENYIQLKGGGLLKAGDQFPARIPQAGDQTFTVVVDMINDASYTLRINNAKATGYFNELTAKAGGITRDGK